MTEYSRSKEEDRRYRRYTALAVRILPLWARASFAGVVRDALSSLYWARKEVRHPGVSHLFDEIDPAHAEHALIHKAFCEEQLARLLRLVGYSLEMEHTWRVIESTRITNPHYRSAHSAAGGNDLAFVVVFVINEILVRFRAFPKRPANERKKSLHSIARATEQLLAALQRDDEAHAVAHDVLGGYLWSQGLKKGPINSNASSAFGERGSFKGMLEFYRNRIDELASERSLIAHPGRAGNGLQPYLIRELSKLMTSVYGKPLDNTVALLVSAILNLPEPLTRDDIRPYTKKAREDSQS